MITLEKLLVDGYSLAEVAKIIFDKIDFFSFLFLIRYFENDIFFNQTLGIIANGQSSRSISLNLRIIF